MAIQSTQSATAAIISKAASGCINQTAGGGSQSAALQEATETASNTKQEAAKGDQVAVRKLAHQQQNQQDSAPASEPGKGETIDQKA